ncbi:MAG TPA: phosphatase PAP2 family protein, partial [Polyangiaceae bacterium]
MSLAGIAKRIRPAEWALLGFMAYAIVRMASSGSFSLQARSFPRVDIAIAFLMVITVRLVTTYRTTPWKPEFEQRHRLHNMMLVVFMLAGAVSFVGSLLAPRDPKEAGLENVAQVFLRVHETILSFAVCAMLPLFAWVLYGLHVQQHGRFTLAFFRESAKRVGSDVRNCFPPLALIFAYGIMGKILARPLFPDRDAELWAIDRAMFFGHDPHAWVESIITPWLSEWLAVAYVSYTIMYAVSLGAVYAKRDLLPFQKLAFSATFALSVGYVLYTIVPAQGPVFTQHHETSLDLYYMGFVKEQLMDRTRVPRDCFPSLHTCMGLVLLYYPLKYVRWLGYVLLPFVLSIPFACVYLRYHYV